MPASFDILLERHRLGSLSHRTLEGDEGDHVLERIVADELPTLEQPGLAGLMRDRLDDVGLHRGDTGRRIGTTSGRKQQTGDLGRCYFRLYGPH
jgi:hypothetical protein